MRVCRQTAALQQASAHEPTPAAAPPPAMQPSRPARRLKGAQVCDLLRGGRPSEALALLAEDPRLAWVKDTRSGGYPIHLAAWKARAPAARGLCACAGPRWAALGCGHPTCWAVRGRLRLAPLPPALERDHLTGTSPRPPPHTSAQGYESVALYLSSLPGCLDQRDGRRETALGVARRRRQAGVEAVLLEAGANPELASFQGGGGGGGSSGGGAVGGAGPAGSMPAAAGAATAAAEGEGEEDYVSWSREERLSYRHGGVPGRGGGGGGRGGRGPPPGLGRGRGGPGRGYDRGGSGGDRWVGRDVRGAALEGERQEWQEPERQREREQQCPW